VPDSQLSWNRDPRWNPDLPRDENSWLSYAGGAVYPNGGLVGGWVYQSGPMSVLELDKDGGRLSPSMLCCINILRPLMSQPDVRFAWAEVERVEAKPERAAVARGRSLLAARTRRFFISLGLQSRAAHKVLDFAESKGVEVQREPVFTWTGRAKAGHLRR
jgi:hypothetical protein